MFERLLIANRGEIACRVIDTARRLGIRTIAVCSEAERGALHVRRADEAHCIGPPRPAESYLLGERILEVAHRTGAQALHPGYGFLSENAEFAEACSAAGVIFVGPPPGAIRAMGRKDAAKAAMESAGVPVVPGYHGEAQDLPVLAAEAKRIGYPVLVKAVAGGGGRGVRRVDAPEDLEAAVEGARREARGAFKDESLLLEKFIVAARHVEVQVFADDHGGAVHLFERDCSVQRRHQKVVEEAPAPGIGDSQRARMGETALRAARAIDYRGAGTVEFILDASVPADRAEFFFMEMNTRLQVEHPVTECITGEDLVEWQLRVAAGLPLPRSQAELAPHGHAIEVRLYAENPVKRFLPSTGELSHLRLPVGCAGVRVDTGVAEGDRVTPFYDPMIAKVVAWGEDRDIARRRLIHALECVEVVGPVTNATLLHDVIAHPGFAAGGVDTGFLEEHASLLLALRPVAEEAVAAAVLHVLRARAESAREGAGRSADPFSPWAAVDGFRLTGPIRDEIVLGDSAGDREIRVPVRSLGGSFEIEIEGRRARLAGALEPGGGLCVELDDGSYRARVVERGLDLHVWIGAAKWTLRRHDPQLREEEDESASGAIVSPLPGRVVRVLVRAGARVRRGQPLIVVEAMKMEHEIRAPGDGTVSEIVFGQGDAVDEGVALIRLE